MANIFEFLSKDGNITPEKARKSRQMPFHDKTAYVWMGMLPLKKRVNRDKCSFATKQRMFGVFAIDEILRYRGTRFPGSRTLCHPVSGSAHVDHRSETVEKKRIIHMIPSLWGSGRAGIRFPRIAAFPRWSRIPSLPQRWETASASSYPVCLARADPNFFNFPLGRGIMHIQAPCAK